MPRTSGVDRGSHETRHEMIILLTILMTNDLVFSPTAARGNGQSPPERSAPKLRRPHILVVIAVVIVLVRLIQGRRVL